MVVAPKRLLRCAITDLASYTSDVRQERALRLGKQLRRWAFDGVDIVQLREKTLGSGEVFALAEAAKKVFGELATSLASSENSQPPRLLVNSRADIALAAGADGVHLPAHPGALTPAQVRELFHRAGRPDCIVSVSCHTLEEVRAGRDAEASFILFGPVFEKRVGSVVVSPGIGLGRLQEACVLGAPVPVLALGGLTVAEIPGCLQAGARGVAGIRLFQPPE